jgi:hypothetical protein
MITIDFNRQTGTATYRGMAIHGESDPQFSICRELTDRRWPDDAATFIDERGMACMTVKSIHAAARRYRPNELDLAAKAARIAAKKMTSRPVAAGGGDLRPQI